MYILKDGSVTQDRKLDRVVEFDEASKQWPIRTLLDTEYPRSYTWRCLQCLDQGHEGACVGFGWTHEALAYPKSIPNLTNEHARAFYKRAQQLDNWPGEEPQYSGTSVLAGAKTALELGYIKEYRWAFGLNDLLVAVSRHGPAVLGVNWYEGMYDTDSKGMLHVTGEQVGGHCILAVGVSIKYKTVTLHNSWGPEWGVNGKAKLSWDDMARLLAEDGEACIPVVRA